MSSSIKDKPKQEVKEPSPSPPPSNSPPLSDAEADDGNAMSFEDFLNVDTVVKVPKKTSKVKGKSERSEKKSAKVAEVFTIKEGSSSEKSTKLSIPKPEKVVSKFS